MLDIILIQHAETGINLLEYRQENTKFNPEHSDIFSGFLAAIQNISVELDIGTLILISTKGEKGHNCIIVQEPPINVILLADTDDPIELWQEQGEKIAKAFKNQYGADVIPNDTSIFQEFSKTIKEMCAEHKFCK